MRILMDDGNFSAIHMYQPNAVDDVHLTAGEFFLVGEKKYKEHLAIAEDSKQVFADFSNSPCFQTKWDPSGSDVQ